MSLCLLWFQIQYHSGVFSRLLEKDFDREFSYPLEVDVLQLVRKLKNGWDPSCGIQPINTINFTYLKTSSHKCKCSPLFSPVLEVGGKYTDAFLSLGMADGPELLFVVKSAHRNAERRLAIRKTWGSESRFLDLTIRTVFLVGVAAPDSEEISTETARLEKEHAIYNDLVQADFIDTYFNLTLKTMSGLKWVVTYCPNARYVVFAGIKLCFSVAFYLRKPVPTCCDILEVDDDMYISTRNVLRFILNPLHYPNDERDHAEPGRLPAIARGEEYKKRLYEQPSIHKTADTFNRLSRSFYRYHR